MVWFLSTSENLKSVCHPKIASGVAEFWQSRSTNVSTSEGYEFQILGVIPPDEYAFGDNSVFTNVVAKMSLEFAIKIAKLFSERMEFFPQISRRGKTEKSSTKLTNIQFRYLDVWQDLADHMRIPFDPVRNIHLEYDGYSGAEIKQADVVLLGYPLNYPMSPQVRRNDVEYYGERTDRLVFSVLESESFRS